MDAHQQSPLAPLGSVAAPGVKRPRKTKPSPSSAASAASTDGAIDAEESPPAARRSPGPLTSSRPRTSSRNASIGLDFSLEPRRQPAARAPDAPRGGAPAAPASARPRHHSAGAGQRRRAAARPAAASSANERRPAAAPRPRRRSTAPTTTSASCSSSADSDDRPGLVAHPLDRLAVERAEARRVLRPQRKRRACTAWVRRSSSGASSRKAKTRAFTTSWASGEGSVSSRASEPPLAALDRAQEAPPGARCPSPRSGSRAPSPAPADGRASRGRRAGSPGQAR